MVMFCLHLLILLIPLWTLLKTCNVSKLIMYKISRLKFTLVFLFLGQTLKYCSYLCWGDWFTHVRSSMAHQIWMEYNGPSFYSHLKDRTLHMLYWLCVALCLCPAFVNREERKEFAINFYFLPYPYNAL